MDDEEADEDVFQMPDYVKSANDSKEDEPALPAEAVAEVVPIVEHTRDPVDDPVEKAVAITEEPAPEPEKSAQSPQKANDETTNEDENKCEAKVVEPPLPPPDPLEGLSAENRSFYDALLKRAVFLQSVADSATEYRGFLLGINTDVRRFCERFRKDGCYRFTDSIYKYILRNMRHQMPAEINLDTIIPIVSLMYTFQ